MTWLKLDVPASAKQGIVTIGNFDGVHRGHQTMLSSVSEIARQKSRRAVVVTFDPHPVNILRPEHQLPRLTSVSYRLDLLRRYGADEVIVLPVTKRLLNMSPNDFFQEVIVQKLEAAGLVEGPDFHFGKDRAGDTKTLGTLCKAQGISLTVIEAVQQDDLIISSTSIRQHLQQGNVVAAQRLLGHPHTITGIVCEGAQRGRTLGFATANLRSIDVLIPADGVYAGSTTIAGQTYVVAISIGPNPTFKDADRKVECHLVGFSGSLYEQPLTVQLLSRVRDLRTFQSREELIDQIQQDVTDCCAVHREYRAPAT